MRWTWILGLLAACGDDRTVEGDVPIATRHQDFADLIELERTELDAPGVVVLMVEDGEVTFAHGFGSRHPERDEPLTSQTLFRLASISKQLTAAAVLDAAEERGVGLDTPVTDLVPAFQLDHAGDQALVPTLTLEDLLVHAGGLVDQYDLLNAPLYATDEAFGEYIAGRAGMLRFLSRPGAMFNYSNSNFVLAGSALEALREAPFATAMETHLFEPLGLTRATMRASDAMLDGDVAAGRSDYPQFENDAVEVDAYDTAWTRPAGGAFMSAWDLWHWTDALMSGAGGVLSEDVRVAMQSAQIDPKWVPGQSYGYGLFVEDGFAVGGEWFELTRISHDGGLPGFSTLAMFIPDTRFALIVLVNRDGAYFPRAVTYALQQFASLPAPSAMPPDVSTPAERYPQLAGRFDDPVRELSFDVTVTARTVRITVPQFDAMGVPYDPVAIEYTRDNFVWNGDLFTFLDLEAPADVLRSRNFVGYRATTQPRFTAPARPWARSPSATPLTR